MDPSTCPNPSGLGGYLFTVSTTVLNVMICSIGDPSIYPKDAVPGTEYDFIVLGSGQAGCVLANRLSAVQEWKVLLVEAGGNPPYTSEVPLLGATLYNTDADWRYQTDGEGNYCLGMEDRKCNWQSGKGLGGSSLMHPTFYSRGHPEDYCKLDPEGRGWTYKKLIPFFEMAEGRREGSEEGHLNLEAVDGGASTGELPLLEPLRRAADETENRATLDPELIARLGYFKPYGAIVNGTLHNPAKAYLAPIKSRTNLYVLKNAFITKIIFNGEKRAIGIEYEKEGNKHTISATKEIILSAGTINSAQLLLLSGIGPKEHLSELGIPVVADLPVGRNLQDHLMFPGVVASINRGVTTPPDILKYLVREAVKYLVDRKGQFSGTGFYPFTGFGQSTDSKPPTSPAYQIQFTLLQQGDVGRLSLILSSYGYVAEVASEFVALVKEADLLVVIPSIQHPKSKGRVRLASANPSDPPKITPNYLADPSDEEAMLAGIAEAMRILQSRSLRKAVKVEPRALLKECLGAGKKAMAGTSKHIDDSPLMTKSYWRCAMRKLSSTDHHPAGTCKMGPRSGDSVVSPSLKVHKVKGLRVVDASIMPGITTGNSDGPVYAIAEKGARMIRQEWNK